MTLRIDAGKAFRYDTELRRLAAAVRDGDRHGEAEWIEWKIGIDGADGATEPLLTPSANAVIARNVLGFANRDPSVASNWAEGHAYLLIGVEPGEVRGVPTSDPEKIHAQVSRYVGGRVSWRPEYTQIDGKDVLVVIIDPPRAGDPIHPLLKEFNNYRQGLIFVRHPGKTEQANPDDIEMLTRRARSRDNHLDLTVTALVPTIEAIIDPEVHFMEWAAAERRKLLSARYIQPSWPAGDTAHVFNALYTQSDLRTEDEYERQIDEYLTQAKRVLVSRALRRQARHEPATLTLEVFNPTDNNVTDVLIEVHVLGATTYNASFLHQADGHPEPRLPTPPAPLGTPRENPTMANALSSVLTLPTLNVAWPPVVPPVRLRGTLHRGRQGWQAHGTETMTHIEYDPIALRAASGCYLPAVPLRIPPDSADTVSVVWTATGGNVKGRIDRQFEIKIKPTTFDLMSVFGDEAPTDQSVES